MLIPSLQYNYFAITKLLTHPAVAVYYIRFRFFHTINEEIALPGLNTP